jgi:hypothetical protein
MKSFWVRFQAAIWLSIAVLLEVLALGCKLGFNEDVHALASAKGRVAAAVTISPGTGADYSFTITEIPTIVITTATSGATILYSLDGAAYQPYAAPFALSVADPKSAQTFTVSAYTANPAYVDSAVVTQRYLFVPTKAILPSIAPEIPVIYEFNNASVPTVTLSCALAGATILYSIDGSSYQAYSGPFAFPLPADLATPRDLTLAAYATHPNYLDSSPVSKTFRYVLNVPEPYFLPSGDPAVDYTENSRPSVSVSCVQPGSALFVSVNGGAWAAYSGPFAAPLPGDLTAESDVTIRAYATHPGFTDSDVALQVFHFIPTVPTPTILPASAYYYQYNAPPTVTLSCAKAGVTIYYRVDGVSSFAAYGGPFALPLPTAQSTSQNLVLRVYATYAGFADSLEATVTYPFVATGSIVTIAGDGGSSWAGEGVDPHAASLAGPKGIAVDGAGNVYIADTGRHRVRKIDAATGLVSTYAGTDGTAGWTGDGAAATGATLSSPSSLGVDNTYLYICDSGNNSVRRVALGSGIISTYVGMGPSYAGYNGDGGVLASTELNAPEAIMIDSNDKNLFIADTANNRIRKIVLATSAISTFAGTGTAGYSGEGGQAVSANLDHPRGIGMRQGTKPVYIGDTNNNRVRVVDPDTGIITLIAGTGTAGNSGDGGDPLSAQLSAPTRITVDNKGIYISDTGNNRVRVIAGAVIKAYAGTGTAGMSGERGPAASAELSSPADIELTTAGNFIADSGNGRVRKVLEY